MQLQTATISSATSSQDADFNTALAVVTAVSWALWLIIALIPICGLSAYTDRNYLVDRVVLTFTAHFISNFFIVGVSLEEPSGNPIVSTGILTNLAVINEAACICVQILVAINFVKPLAFFPTPELDYYPFHNKLTNSVAFEQFLFCLGVYRLLFAAAFVCSVFVFQWFRLKSDYPKPTTP